MDATSLALTITFLTGVLNRFSIPMLKNRIAKTNTQIAGTIVAQENSMITCLWNSFLPFLLLLKLTIFLIRLTSRPHTNARSVASMHSKVTTNPESDAKPLSLLKRSHVAASYMTAQAARLRIMNLRFSSLITAPITSGIPSDLHHANCSTLSLLLNLHIHSYATVRRYKIDTNSHTIKQLPLERYHYYHLPYLT